MLAVRSFFATILFVIIHQLFIREKIQRREDWWRLVLCALFGITINQTFYIWGMSRTEVVNAAVLMAPTPVFVFLAAWLMRVEQMNVRKVSGLALSFAGALALILLNTSASRTGGNTVNGSTVTGDVMIMVNAASYGVYLALVKPLLVRYNAITVTMWIFVFGSVPNMLIGLSGFRTLDFSTFSPEAWGGLIYLILMSTVAAYFFNAFAMRRLDASAAGVYIYVQPVIVTVLSAILQKGGLTPQKLACMAVIFAGVYLVTARPRKL